MKLRNKLVLMAGSFAAGSIAFLGISSASPEPLATVRSEGEMMSRVGMNVHRFTPADADRMQQLGMRYVRITANWSQIETRRRVYDWHQLDGLVDMVTARGMRPVLILAYSNPLYSSRARNPHGQAAWRPPETVDAREAFAEWAAAAARRYASRKPVWEIWNEPDTVGFWPDSVDPQAYSDLALQTCQKIRSVVGDAEIWGPGLSSQNNRSAADSPFFHAVLGTPLPGCLSAISVHPYLFLSQIDSTLSYWKSVARVPATAQKPLVSSESGLSNYNARITPYTQASYLVRMLVYDHMAGVRATLWYDWKDDGEEPSNPEHHYGLLDGKGGSKPAMKALEQFASRTRGLDRQCLVQSPGLTRLYAWSAASPQNVTALLWNTASHLSSDPTGDVVLEAPTGRIDASDLLGAPATVIRDQDRWHISGGRMPYFVRYQGPLPASCTP